MTRLNPFGMLGKFREALVEAKATELESALSFAKDFEIEKYQEEFYLGNLKGSIKILELAFSKAKTPISVYVVIGGPGCGKSTIIRGLTKFSNTLVLVPFPALVGDYPYSNCKTLDECCYEESNQEFVFIDEFTSCDAVKVFAALRVCGAKTAFLFGDPAQTWVPSWEGNSLRDHLTKYQFRLPNNYRNPRPIVDLLNHLFPGDDYTAKCFKKGEFEVKPLNDDLLDGVNICFSKNTVAIGLSCKIQILTVRAVQGQTFDRVNLIIPLEDNHYLLKKSLLRVALSRHRQSLTIYCEDQGRLREALCLTSKNQLTNS